MAAHQSIVASVCVKIKGVPKNRSNSGASASREGRLVVPAGTPGIIYQHEPQNPWDTCGKVYHFYPANYTKTLDTTFSATEKAKIVVLAETVEYHQNTSEDDGPTTYIAIVESGYTRISSLKCLKDVPKSLARCKVVFGSDQFQIYELDGSDDPTDKNWYIGRLLTAVPTSSPIFFAASTGTIDVEFFRQLPREFKSSPPASAGVFAASSGSDTE